MSDALNMSRRIRRTPYTSRIEKNGVSEFTVVNHMLLPKSFQTTIEDDFWHLRSNVQIWDVSCQRQVEIFGADAEKLLQCMTPRDISICQIGQCMYIPIIDNHGGLINDPILLKLGVNHFWLSIADSDLLLFAKGISIGMSLDVKVHEPDVSPLAIQGPKSEALLAELFGEDIRDIGYFKFGWIEFEGTRQLISRTGYSTQVGFEIFLNGFELGEKLWDLIWEAGKKFNLLPGCPNLIDRIEGGLLSYGNDITRANNPLEIGLGKYCKLDGSIDYFGMENLQKIANDGVKRSIRGVLFNGDRCPTCVVPWPVLVDDRKVGQVTSAIWSPRLEANVGISMIDRDFWDHGQKIIVQMPEKKNSTGEVLDLPFE